MERKGSRIQGGQYILLEGRAATWARFVPETWPPPRKMQWHWEWRNKGLFGQGENQEKQQWLAPSCRPKRVAWPACMPSFHACIRHEMAARVVWRVTFPPKTWRFDHWWIEHEPPSWPRDVCWKRTRQPTWVSCELAWQYRKRRLRGERHDERHPFLSRTAPYRAFPRLPTFLSPLVIAVSIPLLLVWLLFHLFLLFFSFTRLDFFRDL